MLSLEKFLGVNSDAVKAKQGQKAFTNKALTGFVPYAFHTFHGGVLSGGGGKIGLVLRLFWRKKSESQASLKMKLMWHH